MQTFYIEVTYQSVNIFFADKFKDVLRSGKRIEGYRVNLSSKTHSSQKLNLSMPGLKAAIFIGVAIVGGEGVRLFE